MRSACALLLALAACERAGGGDKTVELPLPKVTVTLIGAGAEPRAPLRLHGHGSVAIRLKATYRLVTERGLAPAPITHSFESTLELVDGVYHERERELGDDGATLDAWFDAREISSRASTERGPKANARGGEPELQLIFPEEAVGVGAKWHEDIVYGAKAASDDVELLAREGDRVRQRITYHAESTSPSSGSPMHHDGTVTEDFALDGSLASMHHEDTYVIDRPSGKVSKGTMTVDLVTQP